MSHGSLSSLSESWMSLDLSISDPIYLTSRFIIKILMDFVFIFEYEQKLLTALGKAGLPSLAQSNWPAKTSGRV